MIRVGDVVKLKNPKVSQENIEYLVAWIVSKDEIDIIDNIENLYEHDYNRVSIDETIVVFSKDETLDRITRLENKNKTDQIYEDPLTNLNLTFEEFIDRVDENSLQRAFREFSDFILADVLFACETPERVSKFKKSVSKNHFNRLIENIEYGYSSTSSKYSIEFFMKTIQQLEEMGEIVLSMGNEIDVHGTNIVLPIQTLEKKESVPLNEDWLKSYTENRKNEKKENIIKINEWKKRVGL